MTHDDPERAACAGMTTTFQTPTIYAHREAAKVCLECPLFASCKATDPGPWADGTWAAVLYRNGKAVARNGKMLARGAA